MFGTLVVQLPSNYEGGQMTVFYQQQETEFNLSGIEASCNFYFAAFYGDCEHEIKPVSKGYCLCLVYNLLYSENDECPSPLCNQKQLSTIVSALKAWNEDIENEDCPNVMAYMLEHQYCPAGPTFKSLKNGDKTTADILIRAVAHVDFDLYVGNVLLQEVWTASHDGSNYSFEEQRHEFYYGMHLKPYSGKKISSCIELEEHCLFPENIFSEMSADKKYIHKATGDEGASIDLYFQWPALLLWPVKKRTAVKGGSNMVKLFVEDVTKNKAAADIAALAKDVLREMRASWFNIDAYLQFLRALMSIGNVELIIQCLNILPCVVDKYPCFLANNSLHEIVLTLIDDHDLDILRLPLKAVCSCRTVNYFCQFLLKMLDLLGDDHKEFCQSLVASAVDFVLGEEDMRPFFSSPKPSPVSNNDYCSPVVMGNRSKELVSQLVTLLNTLECGDLLSSVVSAFCSKPGLYPVVETLGPAIVDISQRFKLDSGPLRSLLDYCVSSLEASTVKVLTPSEHTCAVKFTCTCEDCEVLKEFMQNPNEKWKRFTVVRKRREHIVDQLICLPVLVTYTTEYTTKPYTLVLIKIKDTYKEAVQKQRNELAMLASLRHIQPSTIKLNCVGSSASSGSRRRLKRKVRPTYAPKFC